MHEATVGHLLRGSGDDQEVLLGKRLSIFCNGMWNGPGGKVDKGETPLEGLQREVKEEISIQIDPTSVRHFASIDFYHLYSLFWGLLKWHRHRWRVHFYQVTIWTGEPRPVEGFSELRWFKLSKLPYEEMNVDNKVWMPMTQNGIASGRLILGDVHYSVPDMKAIDKVSFRFVEP